MKLFKRLMAVMFALTLTLGMGTRVYAEGTAEGPYTITINKNSTDKAAHTYGAYQIFKGDLKEEGEGTTKTTVLSNIQWGDNVTPATLITNLKGIDAFKDLAVNASAATVAKAISDANLAKDSDGAKALADAIAASVTSPKGTAEIAADATSGTITGLPAGYYVVKDTAAVSGEGASTRYILEVVSNVTVTEKADVPSVEKKVKEKNDSAPASDTNPTGWQDAADYDIGDYVPFKITGKTADRADEYYKYHVTFIDDQSEGLDAPEQFKITVLGEELTLANEAEATATVTVEKIKITASIVAAGADFQIKVAFENTDNEGKTEGFVKLGDAVKSQDIVVEYTSKLNESAVIGTPGNPNEVNMKFSNNPNLTDDSEEGETPKDKVVVFTYEIKALKVEPDGSAIDQTAYDDALSDTEKANYVKVGDKWQKTKPLATAGFTLFKKVDASNLTDEQKSGAKSEYEKATKKGDVVKDGSDYYIAVKDEIKGTDTFEFKGTDAGAYKLVETTVPSGYNKAADIIITVAATYDTEADDPKLKTLTVTPATAGFTVTTTAESDGVHITTDGVISGKILNEKGSVLPSTGGIGTTIFYVLGGLLIVGAGIVLVARRKAAE